MSKYKRLTNKDWKENYDIFEDVCCDTCAEDCGECERNFNVLVRLAELEDKIQNGTLIDMNDIWYEDEEIKSKKRYIICKHYLSELPIAKAIGFSLKATIVASINELTPQSLRFVLCLY